MENYLTQKFSEIYRDISFKSREQCIGVVYTYLGRYSEGSLRGFRLRTLDSLISRKIKGDQMILDSINDPEISVEAKTAMDVIRSAFIEYSTSLESKVETWRDKYAPEATRSLYELSMAYQGREFNGEKSPRLASVEARYQRANKILLNLIRKDLTEDKVRAIKDLAKRFMEYEQIRLQPKKYTQALREKNKELLYTLERFAQHHQIVKRPIRKKQSLQEPKRNIFNMPVGKAVKKVWGITKKILQKEIL